MRTVGGTRKMRVHPAFGRGVRRLRGRHSVIETEQSRHYSRLCLRRTVLRPRRLTLTCMHNQGTRSTSQHSRSVVLPRRPEGMIARGRCEHALGAPVCTRTTITRGVTKAAEMRVFGDMRAGPGKQQQTKGKVSGSADSTARGRRGGAGYHAARTHAPVVLAARSVAAHVQQIRPP